MSELPIDGEVKRVIDIGNASIALAFKSGAFQVFGAEPFNFTSSAVFEEAKGGINDIISINPDEFLLAIDNGILHTTKTRVIKHCNQGSNYATSISNIRDTFYLLGG